MDNTFISAGAVTMVLIQVMKMLNIKFEHNILPIVSVVIAAVLNTLLALLYDKGDIASYDLIKHLYSGAIGGLTASGFYDTGVSLFEKKNETEEESE